MSDWFPGGAEWDECKLESAHEQHGWAQRGKMNEEKFIVHIHDCDMAIGEAIKLLNRIDYDDAPFEPRCAWRFNNDKHSVTADTSRNNKSVRFDIYKEKE